MKNKVLGSILVASLLCSTPVSAMGTANVGFTADNGVNVGETFTVRMNVSDIKDTYDGIVSMGGNLSFDSKMIEYVSSKGIETPYLFQINEDYNYKIAGLDFTLDNGIRDNLTVYEFTFKALQEGTTIITLENAKLTDSKEYVETTVVGKEIVIESEEKEVKQESEEIVKEQEHKEKTTKVAAKNLSNKVKTTKKIEEKTKVEKLEVEENIVEENAQIEENVETEVIEVIDVKTEENETLISKVQKVIENIISMFKNIFR